MKVMVVTGAARGLGLEITRHFSGSGYHVCALDLAPQYSADIFGSSNANVTYFQCDITNPSIVKSVFAAVLDRFSGVDVLVNNAGIFQQEKKFLEDDWEHVGKTIDVNLKGTMHCTYAVARSMVERESGTIINIVSRAGVVGNSSGPAKKGEPMRFGDYGASKHGVMGFAHVFGRELLPYGVFMTSLCPGGMRSTMSEKWDVPPEQLIQPEQVVETIDFILRQRRNYFFKSMLFLPTHEWH